MGSRKRERELSKPVQHKENEPHKRVKKENPSSSKQNAKTATEATLKPKPKKKSKAKDEANDKAKGQPENNAKPKHEKHEVLKVPKNIDKAAPEREAPKEKNSDTVHAARDAGPPKRNSHVYQNKDYVIPARKLTKEDLLKDMVSAGNEVVHLGGGLNFDNFGKFGSKLMQLELALRDLRIRKLPDITIVKAVSEVGDTGVCFTAKDFGGFGVAMERLRMLISTYHGP